MSAKTETKTVEMAANSGWKKREGCTTKFTGKCQCGCGAECKRMFVIGHDQRHYGKLVRAYQAGNDVAGKELKLRKWAYDEDLTAMRAGGGGFDLENELSK